MKNPLIKRLPREFTGEIAKYIVIFIFMTAVIGLISGFLIADGSVLDTYNKSFDKYNVEDGNFELYSKADDKLIDRLEEENVTIYENFYKEETLKVHNNEKLRAQYVSILIEMILIRLMLWKADSQRILTRLHWIECILSIIILKSAT